MHTKSSENLKERNRSEELGIDGRITADRIIEKEVGIYLTQNREEWRAFVSMEMNLWVP
jgi:hypothetical protein